MAHKKGTNVGCANVLNTLKHKADQNLFNSNKKIIIGQLLNSSSKPVYHLVTDRWGISAQQAMENEYLTLHLYKRLAADITTIYSPVLLTQPHAVHR